MKTSWINGQINCYDEKDLISRSLVLYGEWAQIEADFIVKNLIKSDGFILDIGAFIGTHTISFARSAPHLKGMAIEANPVSFELLKQNLIDSHCQHIVPINAIVSDVHGGQMGLCTDQSNRGGTTVVPLEACTEAGVDTITIDSLNLSQLDFVKVDVEGMERHVLQGGLETIKTLRPVIYCEVISLASHAFILDYCNTVGYKAYGFFVDAYNPMNFKKQDRNIFGEARELAIIMTPNTLPALQYSSETGFGLFEINDLDDFVFLLSCKPQYGVEVSLKHQSISHMASSFLFFRDELAKARDEATSAGSEVLKIKSEALAWQAEAQMAKEREISCKLESQTARYEVIQLEHKLEQLEDKLEQLEDELEQSRQNVQILQAQNSFLENSLEAIIDSTSWSIMSPLRRVKAKLDRLTKMFS